MRAQDPDAIVGWLSVGDTETLAGHAFLVGRDIALTCAHVVRDHLCLGESIPLQAPYQTVRIRFRKLDRVVDGRVLKDGWFPRTIGADLRLADIAVIALDHPVPEVILPHIARRPPQDGYVGRAYGAEEGFQDSGQESDICFSGNVDARGRHPIRAEGVGFIAALGYSGGPAMDRQGAIVWGMVATVDAQKRPVSFAIAAEYLNQALERAGVVIEPHFKTPTPERVEQSINQSIEFANSA